MVSQRPSITLDLRALIGVHAAGVCLSQVQLSGRMEREVVSVAQLRAETSAWRSNDLHSLTK